MSRLSDLTVPMTGVVNGGSVSFDLPLLEFGLDTRRRPAMMFLSLTLKGSQGGKGCSDVDVEAFTARAFAIVNTCEGLSSARPAFLFPSRRSQLIAYHWGSEGTTRVVIDILPT